MRCEAIYRDGRAFLALPKIIRGRIHFELCLNRAEELGHCWIVRGGWNSGNGYAKVNHKGKPWMAHRLAYVLAGGDVGRKQLLDHLCTNRACVRPSHLEPVTTKINTERGRAVLFRRMP